MTPEGTFATTTTFFVPAISPVIVSEKLDEAKVCFLSSVPLALNTNTVTFLTVFSAFFRSSAPAPSDGTTALEPAACRFSVTVRDAVSPEGELSVSFSAQETDKNAEAKRHTNTDNKPLFPMQILVSIIIIVLKKYSHVLRRLETCKKRDTSDIFQPGYSQADT